MYDTEMTRYSFNYEVSKLPLLSEY